MKPKPTIGQVLWQTNSRHRSKRDEAPSQVQVKTVGRKYFTVVTVGEYNFETEYHLDTWQTNYSENHKLYTSMQEWEDERESIKLWDFLREQFSGWQPIQIPIDKLRQIKAIITTP